VRYGLRPFWTALLIFSVTGLWLGGNSWHAVTCSHGIFSHHHAHACSGSHANINALLPVTFCCSHEPESASPEATEQESDSSIPLAPQHDEGNCPICQWYVHCLATAIAGVEFSFWNAFSLQVIPDSAAAPLLFVCRISQPRAPPAMRMA